MRRDYLYSFRNLYLGQFRTAGKYISIFITVRSVSTGAVYPVYRIIGTLKIAASSKDFISHRRDAVWQVYIGDSGTVFKCIGVYGGKAFRQIDLGKVCTVRKCISIYGSKTIGKLHTFQHCISLECSRSDHLNRITTYGRRNLNAGGTSGISGNTRIAVIYNYIGKITFFHLCRFRKSLFQFICLSSFLYVFFHVARNKSCSISLYRLISRFCSIHFRRFPSIRTIC